MDHMWHRSYLNAAGNIINVSFKLNMPLAMKCCSLFEVEAKICFGPLA